MDEFPSEPHCRMNITHKAQGQVQPLVKRQVEKDVDTADPAEDRRTRLRQALVCILVGGGLGTAASALWHRAITSPNTSPIGKTDEPSMRQEHLIRRLCSCARLPSLVVAVGTACLTAMIQWGSQSLTKNTEKETHQDASSAQTHTLPHQRNTVLDPAAIPPGTALPGSQRGTIATCSDKIARWNAVGVQGSLPCIFTNVKFKC